LRSLKLPIMRIFWFHFDWSESYQSNDLLHRAEIRHVRARNALRIVGPACTSPRGIDKPSPCKLPHSNWLTNCPWRTIIRYAPGAPKNEFRELYHGDHVFWTGALLEGSPWHLRGVINKGYWAVFENDRTEKTFTKLLGLVNEKYSAITNFRLFKWRLG
jgi:hypothetical protein